MLTKEEIEEVLNSETSVKDFCASKNISKPTFYNYARKYGIKDKKNAIASNKIKAVVGNKFNRWTVLEFIGDTDTSNGMMKCKCDCGTVQNVRYYDLVSGQTSGCNGCSTELRSKNCGKHERKLGKENWKFNGYEKISGQRWCSIQGNAKKRGVSFEVDIKYAWRILESQKFKCALTGLPIDLPSGGRSGQKFTASLDRIDSSVGYVEGNIQWIYKDINKMKLHYGEEKFVEYCDLIARNCVRITYAIEDDFIESKKPGNFNGYKDIHGMYWNRVQRNAKLRNITFDITKEYVWDLYVKQGKKCKLSGLDIHFGYKDITASIDRIDSSAAYVEGNIQIVHKDINWMKWDFTQDQFIQYCKLVTEKSSDS